MHIDICTCVHGMRIYIYIYLQIQIERERERDRDTFAEFGNMDNTPFTKNPTFPAEFFQNLAPVCRGPVLLA